MHERLTLLGGVVLGDRASGSPLPLDRRGALLAYLAYDGGWVDRDRLVVLFWPDSDESGSKRNLRQLLHRTRRLALEPEVEVTAHALRWQVDTDVAELRRCLAAGDHAAVVELYQGPLLAGLAFEDSRGFDAWLEAERAGLQEAFYAAGLLEAEAATAEGRYEAAARLLTRLHAADPLAEDVVEAHMRALYLSGRREAAIAVYRRFERELADELGLEPLQSTRELYEQVASDVAVRVGKPERSPAPGSGEELTPSGLVGRDRERAALLAAAAPVVMLVGEPGMGKSALLAERYPQALRAGAREGLGRMPFHPLAELLRSRPELAQTAGEYREDLARLVPELLPGVTPAPLDPDAIKLRVVEALARVVTAAGGPLVVDDLQWADPVTLECLVYLSGRGVRVVGAYRPEEVSDALADALAGWRGRGELVEVKLQPVDEAAAAALMADLMSVDKGPELFSRRLWQRTGGNPLFMLETLKGLIEAGVLRTGDSGWHTAIDDITVDYSELDLPPKVSDVIGRRLERLDATTLRVLEVAALAPVSLPPPLLAKVTGLSLPAAIQALEAAVSAGFVDARGRFRHDLLREATTARQSEVRRRSNCALLARTLSDESRAAAEPGILAELWWQAGEIQEARRRWLAQVAAMRSRGLHAAALELLAGALERVPEGEDARWLRASVAGTTLEAGWFERMQELLEAVAPQAGDPPELHARLALTRATWLLNSGRYTEAEAEAAAQRHWFALADDEDLRLDLVMFEGQIAAQKLDLVRAVALVEPEVALLRRRRPSVRRAQFVSSLAALYDNQERHEEALALHREALAVATSLGSKYMAAEAGINLLYCLADLGRYEEGIEFGERALASTTYDNEPIVRNNLASLYFAAGRLEEAAAHYRHLAETGQPHMRVIALARWANCAARLGDHGRAGALIDEVIAAVTHTDYPVAHAAAAIAVHRYGSQAQVSAFSGAFASLQLEQLPRYLRDELEQAVAERGRQV